MATSTSTLDDLRRRIDEIDDRLHDLIMERAEIVEAVAAAKQRGRVAAIRPGREARILRRLVARHRGRFPRPVLVRLWREIFSGAVIMQGNFAVAVAALEEMPDYWDLARDHFGSHIPMIALHSLGEAMRAVTERKVAAAVLPVPAEGEREPWWPLLARAGAAAPRVLARLPFAGRGNARGDGGLDALAIGDAEPDPTEADRSFVALELAGQLSRARLIEALKTAGLAVTLFAVHEPEGEAAWNLVELDDGVGDGDPRLAKALELLGDRIARVAHLGSYAKPFALSALGLRGGGR
ncbi:MAG TPA: chorismate mutase [Stellaceae bacterium]|nr:chorismate mutase [Stellaceae bacterium]